MTFKTQVCRFIVVGTVVTSGLVAASAAQAVVAPTRYASTTGSGTACTAVAPCDLVTAINSAATAGKVIVDAGTYQTSTVLTDSAALTIEGAPGGPPPTIISSAATFGFEINLGSSLSHLRVILLPGGNTAITDQGGNVDHVSAIALGDNQAACSIFRATLSDSLCVTDGANAPAFYMDSGAGSPGTVSTTTLRGDTIEATGTGPNSIGLDNFAGNDLTQVVNATNSIIRGVGGDIVAGALAATGDAVVKTHHCNYVTTTEEAGSGQASITTNTGVYTAKPIFVNPANNDFRERADSKTVNRGLTDPGSDTDVAGNPRTMGTAPDIGAYELPIKPTVGTHLTRKITADSISVKATVNPQRLATKVQLLATYKGTVVSSKLVRLAAVEASKSVAVIVRGLRAHTAFKLRLSVTNAAGTVFVNLGTARTK